jgi:hypothetical protein
MFGKQGRFHFAKVALLTLNDSKLFSSCQGIMLVKYDLCMTGSGT